MLYNRVIQLCVYMYVLCLVAQLCLTLCDPMDYSLPAPLSIGILQARILEWFAMPSSRRASQPRDWTQVSHIAGGFFNVWATREAQTCNTFPVILFAELNCIEMRQPEQQRAIDIWVKDGREAGPSTKSYF